MFTADGGVSRMTGWETGCRWELVLGVADVIHRDEPSNVLYLRSIHYSLLIFERSNLLLRIERVA